MPNTAIKTTLLPQQFPSPFYSSRRISAYSSIIDLHFHYFAFQSTLLIFLRSVYSVLHYYCINPVQSGRFTLCDVPSSSRAPFLWSRRLSEHVVFKCLRFTSLRHSKERTTFHKHANQFIDIKKRRRFGVKVSVNDIFRV